MRRLRANRCVAGVLGLTLTLAGSSGCMISAALKPLTGTEKRENYDLETNLKVSDPAFRRSAEALGNPMVAGNTAVLLENGDDIFPAMVRDILEAKQSVNLETYIFQPDRAGRMIADALIAASQKGVEVRLLVDAWGSKFSGMNAEFDSAGVKAEKFRPIRPFAIHKIGRRTHRKILVVDGRIAYTGGLGIDERWLGDARSTEEWRETQVRVEGPVVAQMQSIFSEDWTYTTGEILTGEKFYPAISPSGTMLAQAVKSSLGDATSLSKMLYYVAIESATRSIFIQNAYFLPDKQVREALAAAAKRGVDVEIMVPGRNIDLPMVRQASWRKYGDLLEAGVRIWEYEPTMMHNKTMVVDGVYSTIGSINFSARSMSKNAEESLAFYDKAFAKKVEAMFGRDRERCKEITLAEWKDRGFTKRLSETVFWAFEPYY